MLIGGKHIEPGTLLACGLCEGDEEPFTTPIDEIGAALMQEHLKDEHGVVGLVLRDCSECGHAVGVIYPPIERKITCKDHS